MILGRERHYVTLDVTLGGPKLMPGRRRPPRKTATNRQS